MQKLNNKKPIWYKRSRHVKVRLAELRKKLRKEERKMRLHNNEVAMKGVLDHYHYGKTKFNKEEKHHFTITNPEISKEDIEKIKKITGWKENGEFTPAYLFSANPESVSFSSKFDIPCFVKTDKGVSEIGIEEIGIFSEIKVIVNCKEGATYPAKILVTKMVNLDELYEGSDFD